MLRFEIFVKSKAISAGQYFIMAVINRMNCYNLNWIKIKIFVHYLSFSCALGHILKSWKCIQAFLDFRGFDFRDF